MMRMCPPFRGSASTIGLNLQTKNIGLNPIFIHTVPITVSSTQFGEIMTGGCPGD